MKRADIMLTFLFYTILALVIFVPTVLWASQFLRISDKALDSYNQLVAEVRTINDGEKLSLPFYMDSKSVVVGFSRDAAKFENHEYLYDNQDPDKIVSIFDKPKDCQDLKACICLCNGYSLNQKTYPYYPECKRLVCQTFDNIDLLSERVARKYGIGKPQFSWKGGFLHVRDVPAVANGLVQNQIATRTFYVQRYKNIVDVCLDDQCITDETKKQIDAKAAG